MFPSLHIILGFTVGVFLFFLYPSAGFVGGAIFFLSSFLIDVDHYFYFVFTQKNLSLKKAYGWFLTKRKNYLSLPYKQKKTSHYCFCLFHGFEPIILFFILGHFLHFYFYFVAFGMLFHLFLDLIDEVLIFKSPSNKYSVIYAFFKIRKMRTN